jgi:CubicO group peptidase (beta-lactamase class C family)
MTIALAVCSTFLMEQSVYAQILDDSEKSGLIRDALIEIVAENDLPGMAAAIVGPSGVIAAGSVGVRKLGSDEAITADDIFHLGSCTKAMTSTMLATLVAEDKLTWDTTLIEVFPELADDIHPEYHEASLWQLVTHRAGLPRDAAWYAFQDKEIKERRLAIIKLRLEKAPESKRGELLYSNLGYVVAAAMAERVTGESWESLMQKRLFDPLDMTSAGFGPPGTLKFIEQPWGHMQVGGEWKPNQIDISAANGPSGNVHCSLEDWAKFVALQLPADDPSILSRDQLNKLMEPDGPYAAGWNVGPRAWAKGLTLSHTGSNSFWFTMVFVVRDINRAVVVATNSKNDSSEKISYAFIQKLFAIDEDSWSD